eukprot:SAG22_NODE_3786_length_1531_cov_4.103352_2_plen_321_part_00
MWACGVILFTMLEARYPFAVGDDAGVGGGSSKFVAGEDATLSKTSSAFRKSLALQEDLLHATYSYDKHKSTASAALKDLMANLLHKDPARRFTALDVLHHPWMKDDAEAPWSNAFVDQMLHSMGHQEVSVPEEVPDDPECWLKVQTPSPRPPTAVTSDPSAAADGLVFAAQRQDDPPATRGLAPATYERTRWPVAGGRDELAAATAELHQLRSMKAAKERAATTAVQEELEAAMAERDALLELKREKEAREHAEAKAAMARTRSAEKAAELAAAKAELARLKALAEPPPAVPPLLSAPQPAISVEDLWPLRESSGLAGGG